MQKKIRIWELDALRGFAVLCVVALHFIFDLSAFTSLQVTFTPFCTLLMKYGGVIFVVLSGVCITLGSRSTLRGFVVFGCGMLITLVTWTMVQSGLADASLVVKFGVLHLLGVCMLAYPLYKSASDETLLTFGGCIIVLGYVFTTVRVQTPWLFPLGLMDKTFTSGDYFPLFPHLGWFMLGCVLGRRFYGKKTSLLPNFPKDVFLIRFFCFCGRHSLLIYLLHQPLLFGIVQLIA